VFSNSARRFVVAALGVTVALGGATGAAGATSIPDDGAVVTVLDAGDAATRVVLPGTPTEGMAGSVTKVTTTTGTIVATGKENQSATIDVVTTAVQSGEIIEVRPDGGFVLRRLVDSWQIVDNTRGADGEDYADDPELRALMGVELHFEYSAQGAVVTGRPVSGTTLTAEQQAAFDELLADASGDRFPAEPVGVGASWTAELGEDDRTITATYTLTALEGDAFTVEVAMTGDAAQFFGELPEGFDEASGTISGTGVLHGRVGDPFDRTSEVTSDIAIVLSGPGIEVATELTMVETQEP
jgi:hypothetical protein